MRLNLLVIYFFILILLAGCATSRFNIEVDSLASPSALEHRSYILLPGSEGVTWDNLQFQEYALYLMRILHAKGFVSAKNAENADVAIVFAYGIGDPETQNYTYSLPVYGKTGVSSAYTYGTATSFGNITTYSGSTMYTPTYGVTGYKTMSRSATTYLRYALITAYDFKEFRKSSRQVELWRTTITSRGTSNDLRRVFPFLISASESYIVKNTGKKVTILLPETNESLKPISTPIE